MEWKYLWSEPFKCRQVLAAYFLKDCPTIVEVGGYKTPISQFVHDKLVYSVDPRMQELHTETTHHFNSYFQEWKIPPLQNYGVVILGIELHMTNEGWQKLFTLINGAVRLVVEVPIEHIHSVDQYQSILDHTQMVQIYNIQLNLYENDFGDLTDSAPPKALRNVYVLEKKVKLL